MRFLNDGKPTPWEDIQQYLVPRIAGFTNPAPGCGLWEVRLKDNDEYLGWILVRQYGFDTPYHETDNIELGWRLHHTPLRDFDVVYYERTAHVG